MDANTVIDAWENPQDLLDRKKYADFLTNYLAAKDHSFVLNLNASWGMGKTYFLSHWNHSIKGIYPTVYINAWESDFSDDPLLSVIAGIHDELKDSLPSELKTLKGFSEKLKAGGHFLRSIAPTITKGLVKKALGDEEGQAILDASPFSAEDLAGIAEKSMGMLLGDHAAKIKSMEGFRTALGELVDSVTSGELKKPLFIFIDELDRCRPTYAIELLETVKHLFSVKGVVFVIATDSSQLQHSIRAIYGNEFDGAEYLRRFFDQEYILPDPDYIAYCTFLSSTFPHAEKLEFMAFRPWDIDGARGRRPDSWTSNDSMASFLAMYSKHFKLSLRSIEQVVIRLESILENSDKIWIGPIILLFLVIQARHHGLIAQLKDIALKNDVGNQSDLIARKFINGGQSVPWQVSHSFGNPSSETHDTLNIASTAIGLIESLHNQSTRDLYNHRSENNDFDSRLLDLMLDVNSGNNRDYVDITEYFDHVEMAGALS